MSGRGSRCRPSKDGKDVWDVEGGYMGMKKAKLLEQYQEQAGSEVAGGLFKGVAIFVNGWTNPSSDELKRLMMTHGGIFHHYYSSSKTTHIIASNLPDVKVRQLKGSEIIVKPEWISECLKQNKLVDYKPFLLFTHHSKTQPRIQFGVEEKSGQPKKSPEKEHAKDAKDPDFLGEFFNNSRLHHISTMAANAKDYVAELRDKSDGHFAARRELDALEKVDRFGEDKVIMHIDMDCFFVSVGLRSRPDLVGKPVAVTHAKGNKPSRGEEADKEATEIRRYELNHYRERLDRKAGVATDGSSVNLKVDLIDGTSSMSEIASCNYKARAAGIKNGMFLGPALKLCPDLQTVPYDFPGYEAVSKLLYDSVASYTLDIQAVSCDEMFVDLTGLLKQTKVDVEKFVQKLRQEIKDKSGCNCSVGLGPNILLARMATKRAKPNGQFYLTADQAEEHLGSLGVSELPGVGRSTAAKLSQLGVETCQQLRGLSLKQLQDQVGAKLGQVLWGYCRGKDHRPVELTHVRKTVSAEVNYGIRFEGWEDAERFLNQLAEEVSTRLSKLGLFARTLTLKLMARAGGAPAETSKYLGHGVCDSLSRSSQLSMATRDSAVIGREAGALLRACGVEPEDMRGVGISMSRLEGKDKAVPNNSIIKFMTKEKTKANSSSLVSSSSVDGAAVSSRDTESESHKQKIKEFEQCSVPGTTNHSLVPGPSGHGLVPGPSNLPRATSPTVGGAAELDPEFLAALPPDIRAEVEAQHSGKSPQQRIPPSTVVSPMNTTTRIPPSFVISPLNTTKQVIISEEEYLRLKALENVCEEKKEAGASTSRKSVAQEGKQDEEKDRKSEQSVRIHRSKLVDVEAGSSNVPNSNKHSRVIENVEIMETSDNEAEADPEVLAALPADIRAEVEAQQSRKSRGLNWKKTSAPILEKSIKPKRTNCVETVIENKVNTVMESQANYDNTEAGPSNVITTSSNEVSKVNESVEIMETSDNEADPEVLAALPADIRAEVEAQYAKKSSRKNFRNASTGDTLNISFSQIDQSVLGELPDHVQKEIRQQVQYTKGKEKASGTNTAFDAIMKVSPKKNKISKKGRSKKIVAAPKTSKSTSSASKPKVLSISTAKGKNQDKGRSDGPLLEADPDVLAALPADIRAEVEAQFAHEANKAKHEANQAKHEANKPKHEANEAKPESATAHESKIHELPRSPEVITNSKHEETTYINNNNTVDHSGPPSFLGRTQISEIRPLLKEWMSSSPVPEDDDVRLMSDFLEACVASWKIDLVSILLKCLYRNIDKMGSGNGSWRSAWTRIVDHVQRAMLVTYGLPLHMENKF